MKTAITTALIATLACGVRVHLEYNSYYTYCYNIVDEYQKRFSEVPNLNSVINNQTVRDWLIYDFRNYRYFSIKDTDTYYDTMKRLRYDCLEYNRALDIMKEACLYMEYYFVCKNMMIPYD